MKLSIVIPVYNAEATLERCLESVLTQDYDDYELILVDDGSADGSPAICDDYAMGRPFINVIHQRNAGLSAARNAGIAAAHGEYITFIDSDDLLADYTLAVLMTRLGAHPDLDILEFPVWWHWGDADQRLLTFGVHEYRDMRDYWLECKAYTHAYMWNKIFRRELFDKVRFPVGRVFEDVQTLPLLLDKAHLVGTTEEGAYCYVLNHDGITQNATGEELTWLLEAHVSQLKKLGSTEFASEYYAHVLNIQIDVYDLTKDNLLLPELDNLTHRDIRHLPVSRRMRRKMHSLKTLGLKHLCQLIRCCHKLRRHR